MLFFTAMPKNLLTAQAKSTNEIMQDLKVFAQSSFSDKFAKELITIILKRAFNTFCEMTSCWNNCQQESKDFLMQIINNRSPNECRHDEFMDPIFAGWFKILINSEIR